MMQQDRGSHAIPGGNLRTLAERYWLIAVALQPLARFFVLVLSMGTLAGLFRAERSFWLTCWLVEWGVILVAVAGGFSLADFFRGLGRTVAVLAAVWVGAVLASTALAEYPGPALRGGLQWIMHGYFAVSAWYLLSRDRARSVSGIERFARAVPWIVAVTGLLAVIMVYRIGLQSDYKFAFFMPGFAHLRHTGYLFAPALALGFHSLAGKGGAWREPAILLALNIGLCLWFGSRGPFFGLIIGLGIAFVLFADFRRPAFILKALGCVCLGVLLSVVVPSPAKGGFSAVSRMIAGTGAIDADEISSGRTTIWKETWAQIFDRPFLGHGSEQFQQVSPAAAHFFRHPHDFILQALFDWGFLGGGAFLVLLALAMMAALRRSGKGSAGQRLGVVGASTMLGFALVDGILFYPYTICLTAVFLAAAIALREEGAGAIAASGDSD